MKARVELQSLRRGISQSELVRGAIDKDLILHAENDEEISATEIAIRQRKERLSLMTPKDGHASGMIPVGAWETIEKELAKYKNLGVLSEKDWESWIRRLAENKASIDDDNPEKERLSEKFDLLTNKLKGMRKKWRGVAK